MITIIMMGKKNEEGLDEIIKGPVMRVAIGVIIIAAVLGLAGEITKADEDELNRLGEDNSSIFGSFMARTIAEINVYISWGAYIFIGVGGIMVVLSLKLKKQLA